MRPTEKNKVSPRPFQFRAVSEIQRVQDAVSKHRPFEKEVYNANY